MKPFLLMAAMTLAIPSISSAAAPPTDQAAKDEIWALEQSIYTGRQTGDFSAYINNTAPGYVSWPPGMAAPMRIDVLKAIKPPPAGREKLTMEFVDFSRRGDVAIIYYKTHRTQLVDGTPVDERFHVTHTWIHENGKWMVFGGMARPIAAR
jgi:ketosteroid isomerase-like protein